MKTVKDAFVPMRDGIKLAVDIYAPDGTGKFPALLAYCPYGKDVQKLPIAQGPVNFIIGNGGIEAGISEYFVSRGWDKSSCSSFFPLERTRGPICGGRSAHIWG